MKVNDYLRCVAGNTEVRLDFRCGSADVSVATTVNRVYEDGRLRGQFLQMEIDSVSIDHGVLVLTLKRDNEKEVKL